MMKQKFIDSMTRNTSAKKLIVSDFDEVLVDITPKWTHNILKNHPELFKKIVDSKIDLRTIAHNRSFYWMDKYVNAEFGLDLTHESIILDYVNDSTFYDDLALTEMGLVFKQMIENPRLNTELVILTHYPTHLIDGKNSQTSKLEFIKKQLPKARVISLNIGLCKADAINEYELNDYVTFLDDRLDIVESVIRKTQSYGKEFMLPRLGYNTEVSTDLLNLVNQLSIKLLHYSGKVNES